MNGLTKKKHRFHDEKIGFSVSKPEHWDFVPNGWAVQGVRRAISANENLRSVVESSNGPFMYMQFTHQNVEYIYPSVQARCCYTGRTVDIETLINSTIDVLKHTAKGFSLYHKQFSAIISGTRAAYYECEYTFYNDSGIPLRCRSISWFVPRAFDYIVITLNRPTQGPYQLKDDFQLIQRSICVK